MQRHGVAARLSELLMWGGVLVATPICILLGLFIGSQALMSQMAFALRPREYPNSQAVVVDNSGGPDIRWDRRTYMTTATLSVVLAFYEQQMPGFREEPLPSVSVRYLNDRCNDSWVGRRIARWINEGRYPWYTVDNVPLPCVSVTIYQKGGDTGETFYDVWVTWPAR